MIKKENVIIKKTKQGYGVRLYFKLLLNIKGVLPLLIPIWGPNSKKLPLGFSYAH